MNDMGTINYANGDKYVGEFKDGKCYGSGTIYYAEGTKYIGEFKNGEMNGKGTYFNTDGSIRYKGEWENNRQVVNYPCNSEIKNNNYPEVILTNIIGGSVENRQLALRNLKIGEIVKIIREPNNTYDKDAIAIYNKNFEMLGYIPKDNEKDLAKAMDNGIDYEASVISKSGENEVNYGANIQVKKVKIDSHTNNNCNEEVTGMVNIIQAQFTCGNGEWEETYQLLKNENKSRPKVLSMLGLSCFFTARFEEAYKVYYKLFTGDFIHMNELGCDLNEYDPFGKELYDILVDIKIHGPNIPDNLNYNYKQSVERANEQYSELDEFRVAAQSEETKFNDFLNNVEIAMESNDAEKRGGACFNAAELFFGQKKYDMAFSYYVKAISSVPSKALYYGYATQALMRIENSEYDLPLFSRRALDLEPENARWHMLHGIVCYRLGKRYSKFFFKTAMMELETALKCCRKDQTSLRNAIEVLKKNWDSLN